MKKLRLNKVAIILPAFCLLFVIAACDDEWDSHYEADDTVVAENNLWETILSNEDLSDFADILEKNEYDDILSASQTYTVWAPSNTALASLDVADSLIVKEFIKNHIARFSETASGSLDDDITMLNTKVVNFSESNGDYYIEDIPLVTKNCLARNGILHTIDHTIDFFYNIWEYLPKNAEIDSLSSYLYSYNKTIFSSEESVAGDVDDNGNTVYLDSVFIDDNEKFQELGMLNDEDSTYMVICPTNEAWSAAYQNIESYYNFFSYDEIEADTLKRNYTLLALTNDLVFSESMQGNTADSLVSTQGHVLDNPDTLLMGAQKIEASNGDLYVVDSLRIKPWQSFHEEIVVEAETLSGRENTFSAIYSRNSYGSSVSGISNNYYIDIIPTNAASNPSVTFEVPNTLSAAYNIYCVFVPETVENSSATDMKPNKVSFQLTYLKANGRNKTVRYTGDDFVTVADTLYKMPVVSNFSFPTANYDQEDVTVKLKVISNVKQNETTTYSRHMRIDCLILEPAH